MISTILLAAMLGQAPPAAAMLGQAPPAAARAPAEEAQEIVVTGTRRSGCRVQLADRTLTRRQLAERARIWAAEGRPVRVVRPAGAGYDCMARIAFRLGDYGVRFIHFVDRPGQ